MCSVPFKMRLCMAVICALCITLSNSAKCSKTLNTVLCVNITLDAVGRLPSHYENEMSLVIQNSELYKLSPRIFSDLRFLTNVTLLNCAIKEIDDHAFDGLTLRSLNLRNNFISNISNDLLKNMKHLEILDLSHNKISYVGGKAFANLKELTLIDLSHNNLTQVPIIGSLTKLRTLILSNNKLTDLQVEPIVSLPHIQEFFFEGNLYSKEYEESLREKFRSTGIVVNHEKNRHTSKNVTVENSTQPNIRKTKSIEQNSSSVADDVGQMLKLSPELIMSLNSSEIQDYIRRITLAQSFIANEQKMLELDRARVLNETESVKKELNRVEQIKKRIEELATEARTESAEEDIQKTCDKIPADSWFKRFKRWKCRMLLRWGRRIAIKNTVAKV